MPLSTTIELLSHHTIPVIWSGNRTAASITDNHSQQRLSCTLKVMETLGTWEVVYSDLFGASDGNIGKVI